MLIRSFWYGADDSIYARLARVLEYSAKRYHSDVLVTRMPELPANRSEAFILKARDWTQAIATAIDNLALLDCDTYVRGDLSHVFDRPFDIAVTRDEQGRLNSGVLLVRPSKRVNELFAHWQALTALKCERNTPDVIRYGDQDALELMLRSAAVHVIGLPMRVYNSTQRTWARGLDSALVVHVKSDARKHIERGAALTTPGADKVVAEWLALESLCST